MENTDAHWKEWGSFDPYRAVLFDGKYARTALNENLQEFFETGRLHVAWLMQKLNLLYPGLRLETAVDFGCGVGRLAIPLAREFGRVIGIDIAPNMLVEARKNCSASGVTNIDFVFSDDLLSRVPDGIQLAHSFLVLQHIPVKRGLRIIKTLLERLAPGGVCALHVLLDRKLPAPKKMIYFGKHGLPGARYLLNVLQGKPIREPLMQMNPYPLGAVCDVLAGAGMKDLWLVPLTPVRDGVVCFGRKSK